VAKVVILGAGLTGLSTAYHLEEKFFFDYKIFEKDTHPGGLCRSISVDGFTFDYTGHWIHISNQYFQEFLNKILEKNKSNFENTFNHFSRKAFIYSHDTFVKYPFQVNLSPLPQKVIIECIKGFINRKTNLKQPKNFHQWVLKYFGNGIGKHFLFPYNGKLLATNPKTLHHSWTGRFVPKITLDDILQGSLDKNFENQFGYNQKFYYPKNGGIQTLTDNIKNCIQNKIETNYKATKIDLKNKIVIFENGHSENFDILINTTPLKNMLLTLQEKPNSKLQTAAHNLKNNSVINFNLGINKSNLTDKNWIYIPQKQYPFYRIGFFSSVDAQLTPKNQSSLYGEISFIAGKKSKIQINNLTQKSINLTLDFLKLKKENISLEKNLFIENAYVIYDSWREKNLQNVITNLKEYSIYSIGRYGEWKYSSMEEAILDGKNITDQIFSNSKKLFQGATKSTIDRNEEFSQKKEIKNERVLQK